MIRLVSSLRALRHRRLLASLVGLAGLAAPATARAQLAPYAVEVDSAPYASLSNPTTHTFQAFGSFPAADEGSVTLSLPFTFNFYGEDYDEVIAFTNGVVAFEPVSGSTSILAPASRVPRANDDLDAYISGVWQDLEFSSGTSELRTKTLGSAPNRTFVIEYADFVRKGQPNDRINFRIELDEDDYTIRVWFGAVSGIFGSTTAMEGEDGLDGLNLLASSASCGIGCSCAPVSCGNANYPSGRRITATLPDAPDLYGTIEAPPGASPGSSFSATIRVENGGLVDAAGSSFEVWLADNPNDLSGGTLLTTGTVGAVSALDRAEVQRSIFIPLGTFIRRWYIAIEVDIGDAVAEAREDNNLNIGDGFGTGPDLTGSVSVPFIIGPGEQVPITVEARSDGAPTTRPFGLSFFLSPDRVIDANDLAIGQTTATLSGDGFAGTITARPTLPGSIPFGTAHVLARLDAANAIAEIDETNNDLSTEIASRVETADLDVPLLSTRGGLFQGQPAEVEVTVRNTGAARAEDFSVCLFLTSSRDPDPPLSDLVFEATGLTVLPDSRARLRLQPRVQDDIIGNVRIVAEVDCRDDIDEATESDNVRARETVVFASGPDLTVTWTSTAVPGEAGEPYPLQFQVDNLGAEAASAQVDLVLEGEASSGSVPVLSAPVRVEVQGGATFAESVVLPSDLPSGRYDASLRVRVVQGSADPVSLNDTDGPRAVDLSSFGVAFVGPRPPSAVLEQPYRWTFGALGGDGAFDWSLTWADRAPPGLAFDAATASLAGQAEQLGSYDFDLRVSSGGFINDTTETLVVVPPSLPLTIATRAMPPAVVGEFYAETIRVLGGTPPYRFESDDAPLTLQATGRLTGEPPFATARFFDVCVTDARNERTCATIAYSAIDPSDVIEIGLADLPNGLVDRPYEISIPVTDAVEPVQFSLDGGLPAGLEFDPIGGRLFGRPEVAGVFPIIIEARDASGRFDRNPFVLVVLEAGSLQIVTQQLPEGRLGEPYSVLGGGPVELEAEGASPDREVVWTLGVGELPPGLSLVESRIEGTPTERGTYAFTLVAFDSSGDSARRFYGVTVTDGGGAGGGGGGCVGVDGSGPGSGTVLGLALIGWLAFGRRRRWM